MKFITSTHLKQWADTKECQQLLPELIRRLIESSVTNIDKLFFPSGDNVSLPGWDGILTCGESIGPVPAGVSLWECGATKDVKGKIDDDFSKRDENPLGYDKSTSTFVFVTPRIWTGADDWVNNHQNGWKKVIVFTAVELEQWIERRPSVGMWLAEKRQIFPSGGYMLPETYWNRWAQGEKITLPYDIVLPGREEISKQIVDTCKVANSLTIQALTQNEGIAFAIASILTSEDADRLKSRMIVVTEKDAYNDLVEHYDNLILLTTVTEDIHYSTKRGHSVIVASTPADQIKKDIVPLPIIEKEGFVKTLVSIGIDDAKARAIAKDTARDINVFRRREGIAIEKPKWFESIEDLLPAILVGKWTDTVDGDKNVLELLSGMKYEQYEKKLSAHLMEEETPLIQVGNTWRIRSPYEAIDYAQAMFTTSVLNKFREVCQSLIQDDDPEAIDKIDPDIFRFRKSKQKYSNIVKEGVYQTLCLLSIVDDSYDKKHVLWVDETVKELLKDWDFSRFLSNKQYLTDLAEASPKEFLNFIEKVPTDILDVVFSPYQSKYSISGWEIEYTEILFALEMLAWDENHLNRVTNLLLKYSEYANESNYANRPINSLYNIYRFYLPQTYLTYKDRMTLLRAFSSKYKETIFRLCIRMCESLNGGALEPNQYYRWRMFGKIEAPKYIKPITIDELNVVVTLMLECCSYSAESITELLVLSSNKNMWGSRNLIIDTVRENIICCDDKQIVADTLRKNITHHLSYQEAQWALSEAELEPYQNLLNELEPKDVLHKNAWLFESIYVQLPHDWKNGFDFEKNRKELLEIRTNALREIIASQGKEGIWNFVDLVKCQESLAESLVSIYGRELYDDVCQKYKSKEISESFARSYFSVLCYSDTIEYQKLAKRTLGKDKDLLVLLCAPRYIKGLADVATSFGDSIKQKYWESVEVGYIEMSDAVEVIHELVKVARYYDAIHVIYHHRTNIQISDVEIVKVIYGCITYDVKMTSQMDHFYLSTLLTELDKSENPEVIKTLIVVEFLLYRVLEHQMDVSQLRFTKELSRDPELMIQLVELAYRPDDGKVEQLENDGNKRLLSENAFHILYFGRPIVLFNNEDGAFDGERMRQYIESLYRLAKERKRVRTIDYVVGDILGDIPRDENYPPQALCELVEELGNDVVDQHISTRIHNSRGITSRAYNEGGNQERSIVSKFEKYREKTKLLYPRMTKIFDDLIKEYKNEAYHLDDEAKIADLES